MERQHLTLSETADYLNLTERSVNNLTREGKLKAYRPNGKRVYIFKKDIDEYILRGKIKPTKQKEAIQ